MSQEILLPKFDQSMEEATISSWKVKIGDRIEKGQVVCEIETDKATVEVESNTSGALEQLLVKEGETVAVNTVIATISEYA